MAKKMVTHPMQPLVKGSDGIVRFKENKVVRFLLDKGKMHGVDMNTLAIMPFDQDDREQFLQLIGYSLSGFEEMSSVRASSKDRAMEQAAGLSSYWKSRVESSKV